MHLSIVIHTDTARPRPHTAELSAKRVFRIWFICTERPLSDQWWERGIRFRRLIWLEKPTHGKLIPKDGIPADSVSEKEMMMLTLERAYQLSRMSSAAKSNIPNIDYKNETIPIYLWHRFDDPQLLDDKIVEKYNC